MKKNISNSIIALILTFIVLIFYFQRSAIENIELKLYDIYSSFRGYSQVNNQIALLEIDDESISKIGRWPWERSTLANLINWLNSNENSKPSLIGLNILLTENEDNKARQIVNKIEDKYKELISQKKIKEISKESEFISSIEVIKKELDNDLKLQIAISSSSNIILPMFFELNEINSKVREEPNYFKNSAITINQNSKEELPAEASNLILPIQNLASVAKGIGHVNIVTDIDGSVRRHLPFISYNNNIYPSMALQIANFYSGEQPKDIILKAGEYFKVGKQTILISPDSYMYISYHNGEKPFKTYSFYDVINNKIVPEAFKNKIVLVGLTAHGLGTSYVTPVQKSMSNLEQLANVIENLLSGIFIYVPKWSTMVEILTILIVGLFVIIGLPLLKAAWGAIVSGIILLSLIASSFYFFVYKGIWIRISYASILLLSSYILIVTRRFFSTEKKKELIEVSQIETNKMLGLSFQGQGMLDLAFEKFRLCPIDDTMKDLLYNLALDFERKRQFNKAKAVYEHIAEKDPGYKDIKTKIENLAKAADGAVFASPVGKTKESTILVEGTNTVPTLGRYEVIKELGKGAMGIVYLGKDPKINRTVAIKTMRFEEGIDDKELKNLKDRFFREAQAAGNLSHPNIVKIYDAGEDQDIAYMAMELLKGEDLKKYTTKENLLPIDKVLTYIYQVALALDYAHKNGVIHRDIKPANIMILEDGTLRVTDFGIARIQESSKTATGTVMGTPYYMSPEQIAGKKVDGRADLFSLGVTMYELLTGEKPWKGGESIATLFYQITNEGYPDPREYRKEISPEIVKIIDKALKKNPDERYKTGEEMASDIKIILDKKNLKTQIEEKQIKTSNIQTQIKDIKNIKDEKIPQKIQDSQQIKKDSITKNENIQTETLKPTISTMKSNIEIKPSSPIKIQESQVKQILTNDNTKISKDKSQSQKAEIKTPQETLKIQTSEPKIEKEPQGNINIPEDQKNKSNINIQQTNIKVEKKGTQLPITETLNQEKINTVSNDFEKTLPLIYPDEGGKSESKS